MRTRCATSGWCASHREADRLPPGPLPKAVAKPFVTTGQRHHRHGPLGGKPCTVDDQRQGSIASTRDFAGRPSGLQDAIAAQTPHDTAGRDQYRHPMQWDSDGGFSGSDPWLPMANPERLNVEHQREDADSLLSLYRGPLNLRSSLNGGISDVATEGTLLTYRRDDHVVAINFGEEPCKTPVVTRVIFSTTNHDGDWIALLSGIIGFPNSPYSSIEKCRCQFKPTNALHSR